MERRPYPGVPGDISAAMSSLSFDDPTFSVDPSFHPDHHPSFPDSQPPPYEILVSPETSRSSHIRHPASSSMTSLSSEKLSEGRGVRTYARTGTLEGAHIQSPSVSTSASSSGSYSNRDSELVQGELLPYLQDDEEQDGLSPVIDHHIPQSLLPGRPRDPIYTRAAVDSQWTEGPRSDVILNRSMSLPGTAERSISAPPAPVGNVRPSMPRRGHTTSSRQKLKPGELDRVDELDESFPLGYHHRGPYEVSGRLDTPPARVLPIQADQPVTGRRVIVEDNSLAAAPAPVPFKLDLKPGEFLTRLQSSALQQPLPVLMSNLHNQQTFTRKQDTYQENRIPYYLSERNGADEWSPECLYQDATKVGVVGALGPRSNSTPEFSRRVPDPRRPPLVPNPSRQSVRFADEQIIPRDQSSQVSSSNSSIYSDTSRSRPLVPPSSADRFRPKRIVMPAPLQSPLQQNMSRPVLAPANSASSYPPAVHTSAAHIPIHDQKKGNLLRKRASMKSSLQRQPSQDHIVAHGLADGGSYPIAIEEQKLPRAARKLSKRKT